MDYVLGIDGGGTNTLCVIADKKGNLLSKGMSGPSNCLVVGKKQARLSIVSAVEGAKRNCSVKISRFKVACLGMAGVFRPATRAMIEKIIKELDIADKVVLDTDAAIALAGAVADFGVVVVAGTGSIAFGLNRNGEIKRASGWGYLLGDEGSAYDIGLKAIRASLRAYDGRGDKTLLVSKLVKRLNLAAMDKLIERVYINHMEPHEIAALAPVVVEAAKEGDHVARNILMETGKELGLAVHAVIKGLHMENESFDVALTGGVFDAGDLILKSFEEVTMKIAPKCRIIPAKYEPVIGAVLIALREIGVEIDDDVFESIEATLANI
jgi:N-acetylglucosamine kinase